MLLLFVYNIELIICSLQRMLSSARRTLKLPHRQLILRTKSLDICAGHSVTLSRVSWPLLTGLLGEINVTVYGDSEGDQIPDGKVQEQNEASSEFDIEYDEHEHENREDADEIDSEDEIDAPEEDHEWEPEHEGEHAHNEDVDDELQVKQEVTTADNLPKSPQRPPSPVPAPPTPIEQPVTREVGSLRSGTSNTHEIEPSQPPSSQPASSQGERLILTITYDDPQGEHMQSMFKIRSTATIRSALKGACRTFGLDVERASLSLVQDDGDGVEVENKCPKTETVGGVGAIDGSKFVIKMEYD